MSGPSPSPSDGLLAWAADQPRGSVIEASATLGPTGPFGSLLDKGWKGLYINPDPEAIDYAVQKFNDPGASAMAFCARLDLGDERLTPGPRPGLIAAGIHPNQLYKLFTEPNPPLPEPRIAVVALPENGFRILDILSQWARLEAVMLTVATDEEAAEAGAWLSAGWKHLGVEGLTISAARTW